MPDKREVSRPPSCVELDARFLKAAQARDWRTMTRCVEEGADVNTAGQFGMRGLMYPALAGELEVVRFLVEHGADVNGQNTQRHTVLMEASRSGRLELVRWLIEKGASVEAVRDDGFDMLTMAAGGSPEVVRLYVEEYGLLRETQAGSGGRALVNACVHGKLEIVRYLLERGASLEGRDYRGFSTLWVAVEKGFVEIARLLLVHGSSPVGLNKYGEDLLKVAARSGSADMVRLVADALEQRERVGSTPASRSSNQCSRPGDPQEGEQGVRLLEALFHAVKARDVALVGSLVRPSGSSGELAGDGRVDVDATDSSGRTALMVAAAVPSLPIVRLLVEAGADPSKVDHSGHSALSYVPEAPDPEMENSYERWCYSDASDVYAYLHPLVDCESRVT